MTRRIAPPLPAASLPSNTATTDDRLKRGSREAQVQASLPLLERLLVFALVIDWSRSSARSTFSRSLRVGSGGVLSGSRLAGFVVEPLAHRREQVPADRERAVARVGARHHDPGRLPGRGLAQERLADRDEAVVELEVLPVGSVTRQRVFGSFSSAFRRFFCWSFERWNQNLSSSAPSSHEHLLEPRISSDLCVELGLVDLADDALDDRHGVPGAEEDADLSLGRQRAPEAPHAAAARAPRPTARRTRGSGCGAGPSTR